MALLWHTWADVLEPDNDIVVSVRSAVLVPAPQGVKDLVHDDALVLAAVSDGYVLHSSRATHKGVAPGDRGHNNDQSTYSS